MSIKFVLHQLQPKTFRFQFWNSPCPCGCDLRENPNLKSYALISLYFFGFSILFLKNKKEAK